MDERKRTGLIFDDKMTEHLCLWDNGHIENPERYLRSFGKLKEYNLLDRCQILPSRSATVKELCLVHTEEYIDVIKNSKLIDNPDELENLSSKYDSVYFNSKTYDCALLAAGSAIELVTSVVQGSISNGLALVRPPGHHAMVNEACGFCFFNNVAIGAKYALEQLNLKRILIIDWDVHHGQGTQQIFYDDPRVLYFSIHRFENGDFWPNLKESHFTFIGKDVAQGLNINVPLNCTSLENGDYLAIFNNILLPIAYEFNPELVLISAGYDAAIGCPEGEMRITPFAYPHFLNSLSCLANGKICVILEGGYCLTSLSESVAMTVKGLLGDPCPPIPPSIEINKDLQEMILNVITVQRPFWESLKLQKVYSKDFDDDNDLKHSVKVQYNGNPRENLTVYKTRGDYPVQPENVVKALESEIKEIVVGTHLTVPNYRSGFVLNLSYGQEDSEILSFYKILQGSKMFSKFLHLQASNATPAELSLHQDVQFLNSISLPYVVSEEVCVEIGKKSQSDSLVVDAYKNLLQLTDAVVTGVCMNGYAIVSPPLFTNSEDSISSLVVAVHYLSTQHKMNKILLVDLDNPQKSYLQNAFFQDDKVLYVSLNHQKKSKQALQTEIDLIGEDVGKGYNINIPFSHTVHDGDYMSALFHIVLPVAYEFCPDIVLVNLGLQSNGNSQITSLCYGVIVKLLSSFASGKVVLVSEGNFKDESVPESVAHCLSSLLGESPLPFRPMRPTPDGIETVQHVFKAHKAYWQCLAFDVKIPDKTVSDFDNSLERRRQSSNPVAIPNALDGATAILMDYEKGDQSPEEFFCVTPIENCPHLEFLQPIPNEGLNLHAPCVECENLIENWVCLHCYQVYCGRFVNQHMLQHGLDMNHYLTLSFSDLSVWCYACDSYVHNNLLTPIKDHACDKKFGSA